MKKYTPQQVVEKLRQAVSRALGGQQPLVHQSLKVALQRPAGYDRRPPFALKCK